MSAEVGACPAHGRAQDSLNEVSEVAASVLSCLGGGKAESCAFVGWISRRRQKLVLEFEVAVPQGNDKSTCRYIVKIYKSDGGVANYEALARLWVAGFRPPSSYTVVRPVAYVADQGLLVQEKARGTLVRDLIFEGGDRSFSDGMSRTARWLARLHTSSLEAPARRAQVMGAVVRYSKELPEMFPAYASRIQRIGARALEQLEWPARSSCVPSHGDFHPRNVFISGKLVTVVDFDTFGRQEAEADVAYFLAQTAIMGFFRRGSFAATSAARDCFLRAYESAAPALLPQRLELYVGITFLQSLHYELWVLRNENYGIIEPWLDQCERCVLDEKAAPTDLIG